VGRYGWSIIHNATVVECPGCNFTMGIEHESVGPDHPFYDCPNCGDSAAVPHHAPKPRTGQAGPQSTPEPVITESIVEALRAGTADLPSRTCECACKPCAYHAERGGVRTDYPCAGSCVHEIQCLKRDAEKLAKWIRMAPCEQWQTLDNACARCRPCGELVIPVIPGFICGFHLATDIVESGALRPETASSEGTKR
jgi:hypothetical protein